MANQIYLLENLVQFELICAQHFLIVAKEVPNFGQKFVKYSK